MKTQKTAVLFFFLIFSLFISGRLNAQIFNPVEWKFEIVKQSDSQYELVMKGEMEEGWKVYSQYLESEDGPIPTTIQFDKGSHFNLIGKPEEDSDTREEGFDPIFEMQLVKYHDEMIIRQQVEVIDKQRPITGTLMFMTCNDVRCLAPAEVSFEVYAGGVPQPREEKPNEGDQDGEKNAETELVSSKDLYGISPEDISINDANCDVKTQDEEDGRGLWNIFFLGLLGGFIALLTPCVFPMIPLTVSFFTKTNEKGKGVSYAVFYGLFIALVYVLLSIPFHLAENVNPDILNEISTNVWLNLAFFVVFILFAFSFFGYYELSLPTAWANKVSSAEGSGGLLGVFFMALTLALVSFSCTGPILGTLLAGALTSDGGAWQLTAGMTGFGISLALPFALFAIFPQWMAKIPRSGSWMNTIKVTLGFIELALALKFLSNADLVQHWGLLKIEVFYGLWIVIFFGLSLYLFGRIRFAHDTPNQKIGLVRKAIGIASLAFAAYLATGFQYNEKRDTYDPLKLLSGLAPPVGYSWVHPSKCPNNIECFNDLEEGIAYAQKEGKPIMIDFTGYACVNCRKMEEHVWPEKNILELLNDEYVLISLYVDDKKELPEMEKVSVERINGGVRQLENYGHKWSHFQTRFFKANSQPFYVLMTPDAKTVLNSPVAYTPDPEEYQKFLECGLEAYKSLNPFGGGSILGYNGR